MKIRANRIWNKQLCCRANGNGVWVLSNNDGPRAGSGAQMSPGELLVGQEWITSKSSVFTQLLQELQEEHNDLIRDK